MKVVLGKERKSKGTGANHRLVEVDECMVYIPVLTLSDHLSHCDSVEADPATYSKEYGVSHRSILMELQYFDICGGTLLPDVMHDVFEGVLQYEAKLVLQHAIINQGYFSLSLLSEKIEHMELGYMEAGDRPTTIPSHVLSSSDRSLGQKGIVNFFFFCDRYYGS